MATLLELLKAKKQQIDSKSRQKTVKPPSGRSRWRILSPWAGSEVNYQDFGQHFIKNAADELQAIYVCVDKTYGRPCEVCNALSLAIKASFDDGTKKLLERARAQGRTLVNAVQLDGPSPTVPVILELSPTLFGAIISLYEQWAVEGGVDIFDPVAGKDIIIERNGTVLNTKYAASLAPLDTKLTADIMSKVVNLAEYAAQENEQQALRALNGVATVAGLPSPRSIGGGATAAASVARPALASVDPNEDLSWNAPIEGSAVVVGGASVAAQPAAVVERPAALAQAVAQPSLAAAAAVAPAATGDDELDALLAELG